MSVQPESGSRLRALFVSDARSYDLVYAPAARAQIESRVDVVGPLTGRQLAARPDVLADADVIFSTWGCPRMDEAFLTAAPKLKAVFYGAGSVAGWATPAVFSRGVRVTTASAANAVPVAEFTLSTVIFSLKHGWRAVRETRERRTFPRSDDVPGVYERTVGLIGMGMIARLVVQYLAPLALSVQAYDPYLTDADAAKLGVKKVSLDTLMRTSDVVSLHAPDVAATHGMIDAPLLRSMKPGGTLINTSRGRLIDEADLIAVLGERPDLQAVLDVTHPEPPAADSPLYTLPNVVLTPHIAGSLGAECRRMGRAMVEELDRYLAGEPLRWPVTGDMLATSAHGATVGGPAKA